MANTNKGRQFFVCATAQPDDLDQSEFEGLTWVKVAHVGNIGETGTSDNIVSYDELETDVTQKAKGLSNAGDPAIEVARNPTDAGQILMNTIAGTNLDYAFKVEDADAPSGGFTNTIYYMRGKVTGPSRPNGRAEDFILEVFTLALNQREIVVGPEALSVPVAVANDLPAISGLADASSGLLSVVYPGGWTNSPTGYTYQWQQDTGGNGTFADIGGATSETYDPAVGNIGNAIRVRMKGVNAAGTAVAFANSFPSPLVVA